MQPVATKLANPFGLHDVLGNVWEWNTSEQGILRGVTGASFFEGGGAMTFSQRAEGTHYMQPNVGFRVLRQLQPSACAPKFAEQPVLTARNAPLGPQVNVTRPMPIPGLRSRTIELAAHQSYVSSIAWSPKGDVIATASDDMSVRLWDRDGNLRSILFGHAGGGHFACRSVSFSPDGSRLATMDLTAEAGVSSTLRVWNVANGSCMAVVRMRNLASTLAWSPDGKQIACTMGACDVLNLATGQWRSLKTKATWAATWSTDSRTLCLLENGLPAMFDVASGQKLATLTAPDGKADEPLASYVAWSPDGRWIAGAHGNQVRVWDAETRQHLRTTLIEISAGSLAWDKDSQRVAIAPAGGAGLASVINTTSGEVVAQSAHGGSYDIAWSPDGTELVSVANVFHFFDGKTGKLLRSGSERGRNTDGGSTLHFSPDGKRWRVKEHRTAEGLEFDAESGQLLQRRKAPLGHLFAVAPDESWRAYYKSETEIIIEPKRFDRDPVTITVPGNSLVWRSDSTGERIAQAFGQQVQIWNPSTGQSLATLPHPARLWSFEWSPNGQQLSTAADDKTIRLWDAQTSKLIAEFKQFPGELSGFYYGRGTPMLAWTRDGRSLWIPLGTHAGLLDLTTGRVAPVENFSAGNLVSSLTLASDDRRLLAHEGHEWTFLRDRDGSRHLLGQYLGSSPQWHPDSRRFLSGDFAAFRTGMRGFDVSTRQRLGTLWPVLTGDHLLCIGPTGHYRGSPGVEEQIVYVAMLEDGSQRTYTPAEFAEKFGWKNEPDKAELLGK